MTKKKFVKDDDKAKLSCNRAKMKLFVASDETQVGREENSSRFRQKSLYLIKSTSHLEKSDRPCHGTRHQTQMGHRVIRPLSRSAPLTPITLFFIFLSFSVSSVRISHSFFKQNIAILSEGFILRSECTPAQKSLGKYYVLFVMKMVR